MASAVELSTSSEADEGEAAFDRLLHALAREAVRLAMALEEGDEALDALALVPDASDRGRAGTAHAQKLSRTK